MNTVNKTLSLIAIGSIALATSYAGDSQFYVGGTIPLEFGGDSTFTSNGSDPLFSSSANSSQLDVFNDVGSGLNVQFGYDFGKIRAELDIGQRRTNIDKVSLIDGSTGDLTRLSGEDGHMHNSSFMLNAFYDHDLNEKWGLYFGAGAGVMKTRGEIEASLAGESLTMDYSSGHEMSYQALVGVTYHLNENVDLTAGYRRVWAKDPSFAGGKLNISAPESLEAGIRYSF